MTKARDAIILAGLIFCSGSSDRTPSAVGHLRSRLVRSGAVDSHILFETEREGHARCRYGCGRYQLNAREIYVMEPDGSNPRRLTYTPGAGEGSWSARWSPDRTKIAFTSTREGHVNQIYVMAANGANVQRLTQPGKESALPCWSPDGKRIAFESNRDGTFQIYMMDADGSNLHRLTATRRETSNENPDWSPDGKRITFESNRDGNYQIYVMDADGSNVKRLTNSPPRTNSFRPRWSPDGTRIVFYSGPAEKRNDDIYVINADGSDPRRLTHNTGTSAASMHPDWSPDGMKLVIQFLDYGKSKNWYRASEIYLMHASGANAKRLTFNEAWDGHSDW